MAHPGVGSGRSDASQRENVSKNARLRKTRFASGTCASHKTLPDRSIWSYSNDRKGPIQGDSAPISLPDPVCVRGLQNASDGLAYTIWGGTPVLLSQLNRRADISVALESAS